MLSTHTTAKAFPAVTPAGAWSSGYIPGRDSRRWMEYCSQWRKHNANGISLQFWAPEQQTVYHSSTFCWLQIELFKRKNFSLSKCSFLQRGAVWVIFSSTADKHLREKYQRQSSFHSQIPTITSVCIERCPVLTVTCHDTHQPEQQLLPGPQPWHNVAGDSAEGLWSPVLGSLSCQSRVWSELPRQGPAAW